MDILVNNNNNNDGLGHSVHRVEIDSDVDLNVNVGVDPNVTLNFGGDECMRQLQHQQGIQQKQRQQQQIIHDQLIQLQKLQQQSEDILKRSGLGGLFDGNGNILFDPVTLALTESAMNTTNIATIATTAIGGVYNQGNTNYNNGILSQQQQNIGTTYGTPIVPVSTAMLYPRVNTLQNDNIRVMSIFQSQNQQQHPLVKNSSDAISHHQHQQNMDAAAIKSVNKNFDCDHGQQKERGVNSKSNNTNNLSAAKGRNLKDTKLILSEDIQQDVHNKTKMKEKKRRGSNTKSFPEQLWDIMMDNLNHEDAFEWLPDGKSFVVVDPDLFCSHILDKTFKASKYGSFIRKLHRWGFVRLTSGIGTDCFHHPSFQRSHGELVKNIVSSTKGGGKG